MDDLKVIAKIHTGFSQKFGIPRQSGIVQSALGEIVFEKDYRDYKFVEGIEEFDYLWLVWGFSANATSDDATVRPPRLGGKKHMGVFATRAPFRPNNIGLSSVRLERVRVDDTLGTILTVSGVDMLDGTPIYDIKPYLPYADSHPDAGGGFAQRVHQNQYVRVDFPADLQAGLPPELVATVIELLAQDPRAAYDRGRSRDFKIAYGGYDFLVAARQDVLEVIEVKKLAI